MSFFQTLFGTAPKQRTMLDGVQEVSSRLIIKGYRKIAAQHGCAPTAKTSDGKIMEIYTQVSQAFHAASQKRGEHIPALVQNYIVLKFLQVNETIPDHLQQHLQYEVEKYTAQGLRSDYKQELQLFDPNNFNDPDVKRLKRLQNATRENLERVVAQNNNDGIPFFELANSILQFAVASSGELAVMAENAASLKLQSNKHELLLNEVVAYYANVAIAAVMIKKRAFGKESYQKIETEVFGSISKRLGNMSAQYASVIDRQNRHNAEMYFTRSHDGLGLSEKQVYDFAEKYNQQKILAELPDDQLSIFYFNVRLSAILKLHEKIDSVIVHGVSQLAVKRLMEYQNEIQKILD
jgi:hypothetical protein